MKTTALTKISQVIATGLLLASAGTGMAAKPDAATAELYAAAHAQQAKTELVFVGTIDEDGFPQTRVMSNLRHPAQAASKLLDKDDFNAYAVTRADTEKLKHIAKNPHLSMYYQDGGQGLLLMGTVEVLTDAASRHAVWDDFFKRLGYSGPDDTMLVVLKFTPTHGKFYYKGKQNHLTFAKAASTTANERAAIEKTIATYIKGHQQGKSSVMKEAFHPAATIFLGPKGDPAQLLYDMTDGRPPSADLTYDITEINISETIGMASVELYNCYGHRFSDMFTLVKSDGRWQITCKVSYMHPGKANLADL